MNRRTFPALFVLLALFLVSLAPVASAQDSSRRGRKYKPPPQTSRIEVTVLKDFNGKPIENAAVVFHPRKGDKDEGYMELKTNEDGKTAIDVIPIGDTVQLQIIARGYQTYGQDYEVDKDHMAIEVRMKRPGEQYSIYKQRPGDRQNPNQNQDQKKQNPDSKDKPQDKPQ